MVPAFQDMELPDIPEELIDPALLTLGRVPFRFRDLPTEIQIQIFQVLKPAESPRPTTEANQAKLISWASQEVPSKSGLYLYEQPWIREARNFLFLNKSTYKDFAPHYYQSSVIRFLDLVAFVDDFLANASGACLYNLRFVSCVLNARPTLNTSIERVKGTRKLADVVGDLHVLKHLQRFEIVYVFQELNWAVYDTEEVSSEDEDWEMIDSEHVKGQLAKLEQHFCVTTFKDFKPVRGVML